MILSIIASVMLLGWGTAHLFPTSNVVKDFGDISQDNQHIIRMEWINEGLTMQFLGVLVLLTALFFSTFTSFINTIVALMLVVMAIVSLFTGFKVNFLPFKLCPPIFLVAAVLLIFGIIF